MDENRRKFVAGVTLAAFSGLLPSAALPGLSQTRRSIRVIVWDERQPRQKEAYENFLGNRIVEFLREQPGLSVVSAALDDPGQGLSDAILDNCDVLIWWGHARQSEVSPETGKKIVGRIISDGLSFVPLHSAHWATPFVEAMNEITRRNANRSINSDQQKITYVAPPKQYTVPKYDTRLTSFTIVRKFPGGIEKFEVHLPYCCFPAYRNDGKPSYVKVLKRDHPIMNDVPSEFIIPQTEMYDEPFHVPEPDEVILEERWETGEWFRSGMLWRLGKGRIFYFRPGHETYPVYKEEWPLKILANAVRWMGKNASG